MCMHEMKLLKMYSACCRITRFCSVCKYLTSLQGAHILILPLKTIDVFLQLKLLSIAIWGQTALFTSLDTALIWLIQKPRGLNVKSWRSQMRQLSTFVFLQSPCLVTQFPHFSQRLGVHGQLPFKPYFCGKTNHFPSHQCNYCYNESSNSYFLDLKTSISQGMSHD